MCESSVYLLSGSDRKLVMAEAAKVLTSAGSVICIGITGQRETLSGAWIAEADLMKHEITLRSK